MDKETRRQIILDNYQNPMNKGLKEDDSYIFQNTNNDSCIDNIDMMLKEEDGIIKDIVFDGEACAICTSATSILIRSLIGKKIEEAEEILLNYKNMINEKEYDESFGMLFIADIVSFEELHSEIEEILITDTLVENWTYPLIQPKLIEEAKNRGFV